MHTATLRAMGGSIAVTIPKALLKSLGLDVGAQVSFKVEKDGLKLTPMDRRKYTLADLLAMQGDKPLEVNGAWDAMPAVGQEVPL